MATTMGMSSAEKERRKVDAVAQELLDMLNEFRGRKNMTKGEFAEFIGVSRDCYQKWNQGKVTSASFSTLVRAAIRCGIRMDFCRG